MQKQTQLMQQNQGFSYEQQPATHAPIASAAADLAAMIGDAGPSSNGSRYTNGENAQTNPNDAGKISTIPARLGKWTKTARTTFRNR